MLFLIVLVLADAVGDPDLSSVCGGVVKLNRESFLLAKFLLYVGRSTARRHGRAHSCDGPDDRTRHAAGRTQSSPS